MESIVGNTRRPDISVYRDGRIDITSRIAKILELSDGDVIDNAKEHDDYYLYVKHHGVNIKGSHNATVHPTKQKSHNFRTYSKNLANAVLKICRSDSALLPCGLPRNEDGTVLIPLIILNNLNK